MTTKVIKRIGAGALVALHVFSFPAWAQVCSSSSGLGSVFSVMENGGVNLGSDFQCQFTFYNVTQINAGGSLTSPGTTATDANNRCRVYTSSTSYSNQNIPGTGAAQPPLSVASYVETTSSLNFHATTNSLKYANGSAADSGTEVSWVSNEATITVGSRVLTLKRTVASNGQTKYFIPGGDYGQISWESMSGNQFGGFVFEGTIRAKRVNGGSCNDGTGVVLAANGSAANDENFVNRFDLGGSCRVVVPSSGLTTLNVLGKTNVSDPDSPAVGLTMPESQPCWNYTGCSNGNSSWSEMDGQHPERFYLNVYYGNLSASSQFKIAARIFVRNGDFSLSSGSGNTTVGEVLAKNIISNQNNAQTQFFHRSTAQATLQAAAYSLTPPIADAVTKTGDYVYRAMQSDYRENGSTPGTSGHLKAFKLKANSSQEDVADWDAAAVSNTKMLATNRAAKLRTEASDWTTAANDFVSLSETASGDTRAQACAIDPTHPACRLSSDPRDPTSMVGTPWRVAPLIVGDSVLFATDDGILYSVDKSNGNLNWGWIPRKVLDESQAGLTATPQRLMTDRHPWGQIGLVEVLEDVVTGSTTTQVAKSYLTGTALGGQLHFSIEVGTDGKTLERVVWLDYRAGEYSPGSSVAGWPGVAGRPYGGQAPVQSASGSNKVAYVVGDKLVTRPVNAATSPTPVSFVWGGMTVIAGETTTTPRVPTSTLLYMDDSAIYFGAANGKVYKSNSAGTLDIKADSVDSVSTGNSGAVWDVNGSRISSALGNGLMLVAQTERLVTAMKYFDDKWSFAWSTGFNADKTPVSNPSTNPKIDATAADKAELSAAPTIKSGTVILYYTKKPDDCNITALAFGPIKLLDGTSALASSEFRFEAMTKLDNVIGGGEATGGTSTRFNGKDGVLAGSGGATSGGTGKPDTAFINPPTGGYKDRLNWRELTNFF